MSDNKWRKYAIWGISLIIFVALIVRLFFTISLYDEVFNIYVSYQTAVLGQRHLVENNMLFCMGDLFNLPFILLFYKLTGGMEGIVLFMRFVYLGFNVILAIVFNRMFSCYTGKRNSLLFSLIILTYAHFSMYCVWYDSAALFFMLAGEMLFAGAVLREEEHSAGKLYLSGLCCGCMVYAYPLMAGVVIATLIIEIIRRMKRKENLKNIFLFLLPYIMGGVTVIAIFCIYCFSVGWGNIYFFQKGNLNAALNGRTLYEFSNVAVNADEIVENVNDVTVESQSAFMQVIDKLRNMANFIYTNLRKMVKRNISQQHSVLFITFVLVIQWLIGLKKKGIIRLCLLIEIIMVAFVGHTGEGQWAMPITYGYYAFWAPFLYFYLEKSDRRIGKVLFCFLWITAGCAYLAVGFTAYYMHKSVMGLYCGAICTFIYMVLISRNCQIRKQEITSGIIFLIATTNVVMLYLNVYEEDRISQCNYRMKSGVYKGILTESQNEVYDCAESQIQNYHFAKGTTISLTHDHSEFTSMLLWGEFLYEHRDIRDTEEELKNGAKAEEIFNELSWADLIAIDGEIYKQCPLVVEEIIEKYYNLIVSEGKILIFHKEQG